jgi:hypothetical protein
VILLAALAALLAPVTLHGVGELRIGMPAAQLRRMGAVMEENPIDDGDCNYCACAAATASL